MAKTPVGGLGQVLEVWQGVQQLGLECQDRLERLERLERGEAVAEAEWQQLLQRHLQLLQRRQLEWQLRAEQRLGDLLARRWWEERMRRRRRVARTPGAARRRWRRTQQRTTAAVARSEGCLRAGLGPAWGRSPCCDTRCVWRRPRRLGGGGKEGGRAGC